MASALRKGREQSPCGDKKSIAKALLSWPKEKIEYLKCSHIYIHLGLDNTSDMLA